MTLQELTDWIIEDGGNMDTEIRLEDSEGYVIKVRVENLFRSSTHNILYIEV